MKHTPPRTKYQIRLIEIDPGEFTDFTWITDAEIEDLLLNRVGIPISLKEAAIMYYAAAFWFNEEGFPRLNRDVNKLDVVEYAKSKGYWIDILPDLIDLSAA